jgi:hypothetical protein
LSLLPTSRRIFLQNLIIASILLMLSFPAHAQDVISLNETKIGQLAPGGTASYNMVTPPGLSVHIEILGATEGLAPQFSIYNASNILVQTIGNPSLGLVVENTVTLPQAGVYRIDVSSATGAGGQFVIRLSPGSAPAPALTLALNTPVSNALSVNQTVTYSFSASPQSTQTVKIATLGSTGVTATLTDASGAIVGMMGSLLTSGVFEVPPGQAVYQLVLVNDGSVSPLVGYAVTLLAGTPALPILTPPPVQVVTATPFPIQIVTVTPPPVVEPTATLAPGVSLPPLPETGACVVAPATVTVVNIRANTSTESAMIGRLFPEDVANVTAVNADRSWYQIAFAGQTGWVASWVVRTGGDCSTLPTVLPLPEPPPVVTEEPGIEPTLTTAQFDAACVAKYGSRAFFLAPNGNCFVCPIHYFHATNRVVCMYDRAVWATRHGRATGLLDTDCPRGQFWDPDGNCWSCPAGYERSLFPVTEGLANIDTGDRTPELAGPL